MLPRLAKVAVNEVSDEMRRAVRDGGDSHERERDPRCGREMSRATYEAESSIGTATGDILTEEYLQSSARDQVWKVD